MSILERKANFLKFEHSLNTVFSVKKTVILKWNSFLEYTL